MIEHSELKRILNYDPDTGKFYWNVRRGAYKAGVRAGYVHDKGHKNRYNVIETMGSRYYCSRLAVFYMTEEWPDRVDHINGNSLDDRYENLRSVSTAENAKNRCLNHNNKTGVSGIYKCNGRSYQVRIGINGKAVHIGSYKDFFEACCARFSKENELGYHRNHGRR